VQSFVTEERMVACLDPDEIVRYVDVQFGGGGGEWHGISSMMIR
jgi:hypothetical protein